jgi:ribonuclease HI
MAEWRENQVPTPVDKPEHWTMYFDGSLKLDGGGAGVLLISPRGEQSKYVLQILWAVSNNEAEYEALLHGLRSHRESSSRSSSSHPSSLLRR